MDLVPNKSDVDFVILEPVSEKNMITIQGEKDENREDSECVECDCFPLCYSSFKFLRHTLKTSKQKHKFETMENFMNLLEVQDEQEEQSDNQFQHVEKPGVYDEELDHKERDEGSQMDVSFCFPNSEIFCQEEICLLDPIKEKDEISTNTHQENHFFLF